MLYRIIISVMFIFLSYQASSAYSVRISQIDASTLLLNQNIKIYVSVTDEFGEPVKQLQRDAFSILESSNGRDYATIPSISGFETMANYELGINFLLMIDNSGSMYRDLNGKKTKYDSAKRISHAKKAAISFLASITNPKDKVGLVSYNSYYTAHADLTNDKIKIEGYLDEINKPSSDEAYTEIYASLYSAVDEFRTTKGRKAIIILSDGANQPYYKYTRREHKVFGNKIYKYTEPTKYCQEEGISVFAIYFGKEKEKKDKNLHKIAIQTGGAVFDAQNQKELSEVYSKIVNQILNEYLITYSATMEPTDKKYVKVLYTDDSNKNSSSRFYFSSTVFGIPLNYFTPLLLIPLILSIFLVWLLSRLDFEKKKADPSLEVISSSTARATTKFLKLGGGKTIIGDDQAADMTIVGGATKIREKHATILFDDKKKKYTIVSEGDLMVNNKSIKKKELESGDVINVGGTTIVFDDGEVE
ncbi:MAG: VWA domain-containing protein [Spirochaetota bacterium]|nr:VWA domain-containing protein [Spirochaetota bacterium]